jgi:exo-1,4-beta-D-glucosaminidase
MAMNVAQHGTTSDTAPTQAFGIRTVTTFLTGQSDLAPNGVRWFAVNGKRFVWRSGGWSEDLFLRYSSQDAANQISLIKSMGLQGIRTEGKEMPDEFYQQFDKAGLIIDGGFQCCDRWEASNSNPYSAQDLHVIYLSALHIGQRLRDHPSVFNYSWSDNQPSPDQEQASLQGFSDADFQDPIIASAEYNSTPTLGPSGEKEGPYNWAPPAYWYDTTHFRPNDSSRTNVGGSWAFDSEILPVTYSDNDITLWPGESQTIRISYAQSQVHGQTPDVSVSGWNLPGSTVSASTAATTALPSRVTSQGR